MGSVTTKESQQTHAHRYPQSYVNSSSYKLGNNNPNRYPRQYSTYPSRNDSYRQLNFIPESRRPWDAQLASRLPRTTATINRSRALVDQQPPSLAIRPRRTSLPLRMPLPVTFKCDQCGMVFPSDEALFKHKTRFCIGVKDSGIGRGPISSDPDDSDDNDLRTHRRRRKRHTTQRTIRHQSPVEKKREEINEWKTQRSLLRSVQDIEDRILRDSHKTQKLADGLKRRNYDYQDILAEYERLQAHERDLLREMFDLQARPTATIYSNEKKSIERSDAVTDYQKDQLEHLQRKNARLERERRIIQEKLEELISSNQQPTLMSYSHSNYHPYRLLRDMKEQEDMNEKALGVLRQRLLYSDNSALTTSGIPSLPPVNSNYTRLRQTFGDDAKKQPSGTLIRNNYLRSGGHDANFLAHYTNLEHKLRSYEDYPWTTNYPEPLRHYKHRSTENTQDQLKVVNSENRRLEGELKQMEKKFENLNSRTRRLEETAVASIVSSHTNDLNTHLNGSYRQRSPKIDRYLYQSARQHPTYDSDQVARQYLTYDSDHVGRQQPTYDSDNFGYHQQKQQPQQRQPNHYQSLPAIDKRFTPRASPAMSLVASNMSKLRDPLAPQPYDPIRGFVVFFDFIHNMMPHIDKCQMVTCLHHPKSGLGEPSQLPLFKCDPYVDENSSERMSVALIATKQPVPRCPPQQALTIVIEVQTTGNSAQDDVLQTRAWTKLPLFDHKNRLLSGRWKVPLRALPIHYDESLAIISTLPTYGGVELYYRLVNAQDADDQSNAPLSPTFKDLYFYPPQTN